MQTWLYNAHSRQFGYEFVQNLSLGFKYILSLTLTSLIVKSLDLELLDWTIDFFTRNPLSSLTARSRILLRYDCHHLLSSTSLPLICTVRSLSFVHPLIQFILYVFVATMAKMNMNTDVVQAMFPFSSTILKHYIPKIVASLPQFASPLLPFVCLFP